MNKLVANKLRQFADVARHRNLTEAGRNEIYRLIQRDEAIEAKLHALILDWRKNPGREGFATDFADELSEAICWYPEYDDEEAGE